ncbi:hypothetical protein [Marinobacter xestospongiae]|uniref:hypothetical protein n=1 Tax=Marinobacter xestospongiae TaxID=994319 RepID=UPI0020058971|nr:hypothetical protein [Marinobacter xestospongiae]MCK7565117.1 hypothetical protein [Marinobacter xestospongiae]
MVKQLITVIALILGLALFANGVFMLVAPETWYWTVPGVPVRGSFNQHFVRDIGIQYLLMGVAFAYGALNARHRLLLWALPTTWLVGHAIFHVLEVATGLCGPEYLLVDFAGVTVPALISLGLFYGHYRMQRGASQAVSDAAAPSAPPKPK